MDHSSFITYVKKELGRIFEVKDLGPFKYFLGLEVARSRKGIFLSQRKYALDLLRDTGMIGCKPATSPMDPKQSLHEIEDDLLPDPHTYQRLVGRLIYLTLTRPDIAFAVSMVSQFMHAPHVPITSSLSSPSAPSFPDGTT